MQIYTRDRLNAIFIQPMTTCEAKCKGCYVKEYHRKNDCIDHSDNPTKEVIPKWMHSLVRKISRNQGIKSNQLTLSLNDFDSNNWAAFDSQLLLSTHAHAMAR